MQKILIKIFIRALKCAYKLDDEVRNILDTLPKGLKVSMGALFDKKLTSFCFSSGVKRIKNCYQSDITIIFKNKRALNSVLMGKVSVEESFCRHDIILMGNINQAVILVHAIDIIIAYLLFKKRKLKRSRARLYLKIILGV